MSEKVDKEVVLQVMEEVNRSCDCVEQWAGLRERVWRYPELRDEALRQMSSFRLHSGIRICRLLGWDDVPCDEEGE